MQEYSFAPRTATVINSFLNSRSLVSVNLSSVSYKKRADVYELQCAFMGMKHDDVYRRIPSLDAIEVSESDR